MKKSTKIALFGIWGVVLLWAVLMIWGLFLVAWEIGCEPSEEGLVLIPVVLVVIAGCSSYAAIKLHKSWRAWTAYIAAVVALALISFIVTMSVSLCLGLKKVNDFKKEARAIPPEQFEEFLQSSPRRENYTIVRELFKRPEFTSEMLHRIAQAALSEFENTPSSIASEKAWLVAAHPNVDVQTLTFLAEFPNSHVPVSVASNPKTPVEILKKLSHKNDIWIDEALAKNPNYPQEIKERLRDDSDKRIQHCFEKIEKK